MQGNPKKVVAQPTGIVTDQVVPVSAGQPSNVYGAFPAPRLVIP